MEKASKLAVLDSAARETEFVMDGITYRTRYGFDAIAGFEEGTGICPAVQSIPPTMHNLSALLYVGLRAHHPALDMRTVLGWFTQDNASELCGIAWNSFYGTLPETDCDEAAPDPPSA